MSSEAHLLKLPQELRDRIYITIVRLIQTEHCTFVGNPASKYDGLRLSCRQLYKETMASVFSFAFTSHQLTKLFDLRANKTNFESIRSVSIEIPLESKPQVFHRARSFLVCMQLSLQELRIFFVGCDRLGNKTSFHGCGKELGSPFANDIPLLIDQGQDFDQQWDLLRHVAILRNLRVLQIENANLPLIAGMILNNKPHLRALSITSDPRSIPSSFSRMSRTTVMRLCRNVAVKINDFPQLEVMNLCANSITNIEGAINGVSPTLRHFSWRVPNPDFQPYAQDHCLYAMTNRLMHTLSWRAPQLETLRLCASMRERDWMDEISYRETCRLTEELSHRLPLFPVLKNLEIHYRGDTGFLREQFIEQLPLTLSRLYISDYTISVPELVAQVRKRYFSYVENDGPDFVADAIPSTPASSHKFAINKYCASSVDNNDNKNESEYLSEVDSTKVRVSCGEMRVRNDDIPLNGGILGFVNYEYSNSKLDHVPDTDSCSESVSIQIMRLNGQLLDREHNLHLADTQLPGEQYGIKCPQDEETVWRPEIHPRETRTATRHPSIYSALWEMDQQAPAKSIIAKNMQELAKCFECVGPDWDWYFGNEQEAMAIFDKEPVAKLEDQKRKPEIIDVEVPECSRCRWACPDFELPSIASFPVPKLPVDWRDHID